MQRRQLQSFQPYFEIHEVKHPGRVKRVTITPEVVNMMIEKGYFNVGSVVIPVSKNSDLVTVNLHLTNDKTKPHPLSGFPISGFPQSLVEAEPGMKRSCKLSHGKTLVA
jgi:hypothetical protein